MVGSWNPQGIVARHAGMTHQAIHDGLVKGVTHMQGAGHIGWWQLNRKIVFALIHAGISNASAFPLWSPVSFDWGGFIGFGQFVN